MDGPNVKKSYIILTSSQKGGVGKSVVSLNLAAALRVGGYDVMIIDTDVANPSIGPMLGIRDTPAGYAEALRTKGDVSQFQSVFAPGDFYVMTAGGDAEEIAPKTDDLNSFYSKIKKMNFNFIIVDTPPGNASNIGPVLRNFDEALIVTTPEETSVFGAQKLSQFYNKYHLLHKLVINRVKDNKYQLDEERIEKIYGDIAYAMIPEDDIVEEGEANHTPAYLMDRKSDFSKSIDDLCRAYMLKQGEPTLPKKDGGIGKFFGFGK